MRYLPRVIYVDDLYCGLGNDDIFYQPIEDFVTIHALLYIHIRITG